MPKIHKLQISARFTNQNEINFYSGFKIIGLSMTNILLQIKELNEIRFRINKKPYVIHQHVSKSSLNTFLRISFFLSSLSVFLSFLWLIFSRMLLKNV